MKKFGFTAATRSLEAAKAADRTEGTCHEPAQGARRSRPGRLARFHRPQVRRRRRAEEAGRRATALSGVTSNPSIFEKAIGHGDDYDAALEASCSRRATLAVGDLYEHLAIEDIQPPPTCCARSIDRLSGEDGYVSLEVSPYLANDTEATIAEAGRLWKAVERAESDDQGPGHQAGMPAIRALIAEGINVNVTLLFSQRGLRQVAEAYRRRPRSTRRRRRRPSRRSASVASFFVSRIDSRDRQDSSTRRSRPRTTRRQDAAQGPARQGRHRQREARLSAATRSYAGARWKALAAQGRAAAAAAVGQTGTKNKAYSDMLYVEELIGARHGQHHAARDDGRVPRPRQGRRDA